MSDVLPWQGLRIVDAVAATTGTGRQHTSRFGYGAPGVRRRRKFGAGEGATRLTRSR
jgi:hypothetical protein